MNRRGSVTLLAALLIALLGLFHEDGPPAAWAHGLLRCVAFSPYVQGYDPEIGPHPPRQLIDALLDILLNQTDYRCIQVYGLLHGLDYAIEAAHRRGLKVSAIIWLDRDRATNDQSIDLGIQAAQRYPTTVLALSCGSEVRTRNGRALDAEIRRIFPPH